MISADLRESLELETIGDGWRPEAISSGLKRHSVPRHDFMTAEQGRRQTFLV